MQRFAWILLWCMISGLVAIGAGMVEVASGFNYLTSEAAQHHVTINTARAIRHAQGDEAALEYMANPASPAFAQIEQDVHNKMVVRRFLGRPFVHCITVFGIFLLAPLAIMLARLVRFIAPSLTSQRPA